MPPFEHDDVVGLFATLGLDDDEGCQQKDAPLPLAGVSVKAIALDFIAEVKLSQCYQNNRSEPVEAIYHLPVDEAACICDFIAEYEDGTTVKGVLKEKEDAMKQFREAARHGKQANLLESVRRDIFSLRIGNLPPGGFVKITIAYVTYLKAEGDSAAFVLPTCIAPRYSPRTKSVDVDEAQALSPPHSPVRFYGLDIDVKFSTRSAIMSITCPTHPKERSFSSEIRGKEGSVSFRDISMDRDLVILVREDKAHQPRAFVEVSDDGSVASFVTIFPQINFQDVSCEIIFVIDRSGSMGWSAGGGARRGKTQIQQASDALLLFLRSLPSSCTFNIVSFGSHHESLFSQPMPFNDETLKEASDYASGMVANFGGTEIMAPLQDVFKQKLAPGVERQVFVLTDGQVSNDLQVFDLICKHCSSSSNNKADKTAKCRLFAVGIGAGVSRHLVTGMARAGNGTARFVQGVDETSIQSKVLGQLKQALQPALDNVSIQWTFASESKSKPKLAEKSGGEKYPNKALLGYQSPSAGDPPAPVSLVPPFFCPSNLPPIFNRERFLSFALFATGMNDIPESVTIKCESPDGPLETTLHISDEEIFHGSIAHKMAAREAIREYEDGRKGCGQFGNENMGSSASSISRAEALRLAMQSNLASELTSFIAVLERPLVKAGVEAKKQVIPQHLPSYNADVHPSILRRISSIICMKTLDTKAAQMPRMQLATKALRKSAPALSSSEDMATSSSEDMAGVVGLAKKRKVCFEAQQEAAKLENLPATSRHHGTEAGPSSSNDLLMQLCLRQTASGSFILVDGLSAPMGLTPDFMRHLAAKTKVSLPGGFPESPLDPTIFATLLAVAAMRKVFASKRDVWELQEAKALRFVHEQSGLPDVDVEAIISKLQSVF